MHSIVDLFIVHCLAASAAMLCASPRRVLATVSRCAVAELPGSHLYQVLDSGALSCAAVFCMGRFVAEVCLVWLICLTQDHEIRAPFFLLAMHS
jgi:hypothetical protein